MRTDGRKSSNIIDLRGGGGGTGLKLGGGAIVVVIIGVLLGVDPAQMLSLVGGTGGEPASGAPTAPADPAHEEMAEFVAVVLADTEDTWNPLFANAGRQYREPELVLFSGSVDSACGRQTASVGPFYCPGDYRAYIDLSFYDDLRRRYGAPGDFAQAYVIAHEVGHHVQNLLGTSTEVHRQRQRLGEAEANALSVRLELQADCYAGVWAHHADRARGVLEAGDIDEALTAASAIGDDRLQSRSGGRVVPESFTHGTSEQRARWFRQGFSAGTIEACDTFAPAAP